MQISCGLLPWAILAPFISIGFSAIPVSGAQTKSSIRSVPECAAGSSVEVDFRNEFWIEVVFLKPTDEIQFLQPVCAEDSNRCDGEPEPFRAHYPLRIQSGYTPSALDDAVLDRPIICRGSEVPSLFRLSFGFLKESCQGYSQYWSDDSSNWTYRGFNAILFGINSKYDSKTVYLEWSVVKVCGKNGTELHLRARDYVKLSTLSLFPSSLFDPPFRVVIVQECPIFMESFPRIGQKREKMRCKKDHEEEKFVTISKLDSAK